MSFEINVGLLDFCVISILLFDYEFLTINLQMKIKQEATE